jgi:hypothetical protein
LVTKVHHRKIKLVKHTILKTRQCLYDFLFYVSTRKNEDRKFLISFGADLYLRIHNTDDFQNY